jgi:regulatory protein PHO2
MEIPFNSVVNAELVNTAPGASMATFSLSFAPVFFMEECTQDGRLRWKLSSDWTEGYQATHVLCHSLTGSAYHLSHIVRTLRAKGDVPLYPSQQRYEPESPVSPVEVPAPPMMGLVTPPFDMDMEQHHSPLSAKAMSAGNYPTFQRHEASSSRDELRHPPLSAPVGSVPMPAYNMMAAQGLADSQHYVYDNQPHSASYSPFKSFSVPISRGLAPRPFSATALQTNFHLTSHEDTPSSDGHSGSDYSQYNTPSPPLLTQPYHPPTHHLAPPMGSYAGMPTGSVSHARMAISQSDGDIHL